jgi:[ribosomal protein S18]-alanine N-acetyltransferase
VAEVTYPIDAMRDADVPSVAALEAISFPTASTDVGPPAEREARLREELARPWSHALVARNSVGRPVGFLLVWHVADEIHVLNVATHPSHRRQGIGGSLIEAAIELARSKRATHVRLEVRRGNAIALAMYRPLGFYVLAVRRSYYPDGEDAIDMDLILDPASGAVLPHDDEVRI